MDQATGACSRYHSLPSPSGIVGAGTWFRSQSQELPNLFVCHYGKALAHPATTSPTVRKPRVPSWDESTLESLLGWYPNSVGLAVVLAPRAQSHGVPPPNTSVNHSSTRVDGLCSSSGRGLGGSHKASGLLPGQFGDTPSSSSFCVWH